MIKNPSYLLVNENDKIYTSLNHFDKKRNCFEGEYSLLHNEHSYDSYFYSRFMLRYKGEKLELIDSNDNRYSNIINTYTRFAEDDIPKYIEEKLYKQKETENDRVLDINLGQLQIAIMKSMLEKELESIKQKPANKESDHYIFLGQQLGMEWALRTLNDVIEKGKV